MKVLRWTFIFALILTMNSCLTFRTIEYVADFGDNFNNGKLIVTYMDIRSSEKDPEKQSEDFVELVKMSQEDQFLLDHIEYGIYIKEREIFKKDGMLNARFTGIFEKIGDEESRLEVKGDERYILIDIDAEDKIESNGRIHKTEEKALIVWPKTQNIISYKITKTYDDPTYTISHLYRDWLKMQ